MSEGQKAHQLKFAANISTMFKEVDICKRFEEAKKKGFKAVEAQFLYDDDIHLLRNARETSGMQVTLINSPAESDVKLHCDEQFGLACVPGVEVEFLRSVHKALTYSYAMKSKKVHVLAGLKTKNFELEDLKNVYINNMKMAADTLVEHNLTIVIEPICAQVKENYFLDSFDLAVECLQKIGKENVKLLLDVFHMHNMELTPEQEIEKYLPHTGHIQISQAPKRSEPSATGGEIDYDAVFKVLEDNRYSDFIGLEYTPSDSPNSFDWLHRFGIKESE